MSPKPFSQPHMKKFTSSLLLGLLFAAYGFAQTESPKSPIETPRDAGQGSGSGTSSSDIVKNSVTNGSTTSFRILSKPRALYTDSARKNSIEGAVRLKVTLLASGDVGSITPVFSLSEGLTEQAIAAARKIKFTPKMVNGAPVSVIVTIEYVFTLYYDENDKEIEVKADIIEMPGVEFPQNGLFDDFKGKLEVKIHLSFDGKASFVSMNTTVPKHIEELVRTAVAKIVFEPAKLISGRSVSVTRNVSYELNLKK